MIEDNKTRVTVEVGGWHVGDDGQEAETYTFEVPMDSDIEDWGYLVKKILYCVGFAHENIQDLFGDEDEV